MIPEVEKKYAQAKNRLFLLDYDGTLTPIKPLPPLAKPTPALLRLLKQLADDPKNDVVIISGRDRQTLDEWLGHLPLEFAAEHGSLIREKGKDWKLLYKQSGVWKAKIKHIVDELSNSIPGSLTDEKTTNIAWHYRIASDQAKAKQAAMNLVKQLKPIAKAENLVVLDGDKVIDIKPAGVSKGTVAQHWLQKRKWDFILAAGDDTTDEDLFKAMPPKAITIKVRAGHSVADYRLKNAMSVRNLLKRLALKG